MVEIFDDIRRIYDFTPPCEALSGHIEFFSESSFGKTEKYIGCQNFTVKMFPSWTPTMWINLGTPYRLQAGAKSYFIGAKDDILVVRDTILERQNFPEDHILTVKFLPGGLESLCGVNQSMIRETVVPLATILPASLIEKIKRLPAFSERVEALQHFFLSNQKNKNKKDHYLKFVRDTIMTYEAGKMIHNNTQVAAKMFTTSQTINRYFHSVIGVSPKHYFSMIRTRSALTACVADYKNFLPAQFGYVDRSHFYKDVLKFTGRKLSEQYR